MTNKRRLSWLTSMRDMRHDRLGRVMVREERLRATAGLREPLGLTSWRGRSGRRYVVGIHPATEAEIVEASGSVLIAVRRTADGTAEVIEVAAPGSFNRRQRLDWLSTVQAKGATEIHVHRLAENESERRAVVADLAATAQPLSVPA
jgi:hypothetical protein